MQASIQPVPILGGAQSDFARVWPADALVALLGETLAAGLDDCQIDSAEIRRLAADNRIGAFVGNFNAPSFLRQGHLGAFVSEADPAFVGVPTARYEAACASGSIALEAADTAIRAGNIDLAVVLGVEIMRTASPILANQHLSMAAPHDEVRDLPFAFPRIFGRLTQLIQQRSEELGTSGTGGLQPGRLRATLDAISANNYQNARSNPQAHMRDFPAGTAGESKFAALNKRFGIALGGQTLYSDCSQISDGAAVIILASPAYAQEHRRARAQSFLPAIIGRGRRTAAMRLSDREQDFAQTPAGQHPLPWTAKAIAEALERSGRSVADLDFVETHDCFTSSEYLALSAFGLCAPGDEASYVEGGHFTLEKGRTPDGRTRSDGSHRNVPVNPTGGLIGAGHPVGASGVRMALDLYRQLTGQAGDCQVEGARIGAMLNIGGSFATNACFVMANEESYS